VDKVERFAAETLTKIGFCDPASGKSRLKKVRARQAIVVIGSDHLTRVFVLHAWAGRLPTSRFIDKIINTCENHSPKVFGIEANAMQSLFADVVMDKANEQMKRLPIIPVHQTTKVEKDFRIRAAIEPVLNSGRLFFRVPGRIDEVDPETETEDLSDELERVGYFHAALEAELRGFPTAATKDLVDCLASCIALIPKTPRKKQQNEEIEQHAAYLRATGMPSHQIQRRIEELYHAT
jgi:hypothetical protein